MPPPAIVLAAGEGTRLRPLTKHRPKPMLPAATKPILAHVLDVLIDAGVTDITVVVGHGSERVRSHFGPTYRNVPLAYVTQERQLGTGHAVLAAEEAVDDTFLVVYGDQIADGDLVRSVATTHEAGAAATLGLARRSDLSRYGGVALEDGRVTEIVEHPSENGSYRLNAGVYAFEPGIFDAIRAVEPRSGERSLVDAIDHLLANDEPVRGVVSDGLWVDAAYPWDLLRVSIELLEADGFDGAAPTDPAAQPAVHETAVIREPVAVDADCEIGAGAVVGPHVSLGANATVESNAVVERSVIDRDGRVGANATVIECVTGVGAEIGPGSTIPGGPGDVRVGDRIYEDRDLGALLADRVRDRGGATYAPGAIVDVGSTIEAGTTVRDRR